MANLPYLIGKTIHYLRAQGVGPTVKKVLRRVSANDWLPADEDGLYLQPPCAVSPAELWHMPDTCLPYDGTVSIVVPTYNGGRELPDLLEALSRQTGVQLELVIVDSGSADDTVALANAAGAKVVLIPQADFSHSYSRMTGANAASGEYLLFMTQDAIPDREDWVLRMLQPCLVSGAAAVSCYETPKADADLLARITVWNWKNVMSGGADKLTRQPEDTSYDSLRRCAQLSDNACLVKRSIFMELGGHRGAYAEDLDLGLRLLEAGHSLGILSSVCVIHSHNRTPMYHYKRAIVDSVNLSGMFADFPYVPLQPNQAASRCMLAACAVARYLDALPQCPAQSPDQLAAWTRREYNNIINQLKNLPKDQLHTLLFADEAKLDPTVRDFMSDLWDRFGDSYKFDGQLAAVQGRYILHTLCPYLAETGRSVDADLRRELVPLLWQNFGTAAGYTMAAAYLTNSNADERLTDLITTYSRGV